MSHAQAPEEVSAFFASYKLAAERQDAHALADHYAFPLHVASDIGEIKPLPFAEKADWVSRIEQLFGMYRAIGAGPGKMLSLSSNELSARLFLVVVHWEIDDVAGEELYNFRAAYTLGRFGDALRICALAACEIPQYMECAARLKAVRATREA